MCYVVIFVPYMYTLILWLLSNGFRSFAAIVQLFCGAGDSTVVQSNRTPGKRQQQV